MINQKPISARIAHEIIWALELERMVSGISRNHILNEGAALWLDLQDTRRLFTLYPDQRSKQKILTGFLKKWWPEAVLNE